MNHCRDCNSDYATPGTCNCFAVGGKRYAAPITGPWYPYSPWWVQPYYPTYPYWGGTTTIGGSLSGTAIAGADVAWNGITGSTISADQVSAGWSFTVEAQS